LRLPFAHFNMTKHLTLLFVLASPAQDGHEGRLLVKNFRGNKVPAKYPGEMNHPKTSDEYNE
jgi:hypothetical protein